MEGEVMQKICAEVQQYLLVKFGNLVALCLPEHLKVCSCCVTNESLLVLSSVNLLAPELLQGLQASCCSHACVAAHNSSDKQASIMWASLAPSLTIQYCRR